MLVIILIQLILANITSLWCALNNAFGANNEWEGIAKEGLHAALNRFGYKGVVILGSTFMHYSFEKAAEILGIGIKNLVRIPVDRHNAIDLRSLKDSIAESKRRKLCIIALVGIAGSTSTGSIDPLMDMAEISAENKIHFHVDAAWGGPLLFSNEYKHKLNGIEYADTVTIDGHKQMYLPIGTGMVFFRNPSTAKGIKKNAQYIIRDNSYDLGKFSLEGSRPGNVLYLHAALNIIGGEGYNFLINESIRKTQYMERSIQLRDEFELLSPSQINILVYRYIPKEYRSMLANGMLTEYENNIINKYNECIQKFQRQSGKSFVSRTTINIFKSNNTFSSIALRAVIANPLTSENDIDEVLNEQVLIAQRIQF